MKCNTGTKYSETQQMIKPLTETSIRSTQDPKQFQLYAFIMAGIPFKQ